MSSALKLSAIAAVTLASIFLIVGFPRSRSELMANLHNNIKLGPDLRGGGHLTLQVRMHEAFNREAQTAADGLRTELQKAGIEPNVSVSEARNFSEASQSAIRIKVSAANVARIRALVAESLPRWTAASSSPSEIRLTLNPAEVARLRQDVLQQTQRVIDRKINGLGISEATTQLVGTMEDAEILVEMPGVDDTDRIKRILSTAAVLEWLDVRDGPFPSREAAFAAHGGILPLGVQLASVAPQNGKSPGWYLLSRNAVIHGTDIRDARPAQTSAGGWATNFVLSQDAARRFEPYTQSNIGNRAAIVFDGQIISVATIIASIRDTGQITGMPSREAANDLALNLRAGSLPAGIDYVDQLMVGPSLGADSIRQGMRAGVAGLAAVVTAMCVYYRGSGVNATVALLLNALLLVAALSYFGAVLTLPGIAGIVLTIGMAVDSNVLVFERIREELRAGKAVMAAIDAGFRAARRTILDTHVTTLVSCACLFEFGTGPVKGFAVTLAIGLVANVFTSLFVSRVLFDCQLSRSRTPQLSI